jgi:plasmid stability protein
MTPEEFGLWNYCRSVSYESKIVYLSGREVAKAFSGISKNVIYRIADQLVAKGWFRELSPYTRNPKTGTLIPRRIYPLDHNEWVAQYSTIECRYVPVPNSGQDELPSPVPIAGRTCPDLSASCPGTGTDLSRNQEQYLKGFESNLERESERSKSTPTLSRSACKNNGQFKPELADIKQYLLSLDRPLKFMPASKDGENPSTLVVIRRRLQEGVPVADIKRAVSYVPLDNDGNPSFALRDSLDAAIDRLFRERDKEAQTREMLAQCTANEQKKAAEELAARAKEQNEEYALIEDELPSGVELTLEDQQPVYGKRI